MVVASHAGKLGVGVLLSMALGLVDKGDRSNSRRLQSTTCHGLAISEHCLIRRVVTTMIEFYLPQSSGEWWAWSVAVIMLIFGLWILLMPRWWLGFMGLQTTTRRPEAVAEMRAVVAGAYIGLGLVALALHPQPILYLAVGAVLLFTAFGRLVSMVVDRGFTRYNGITFVFELVMALPPLAYALGFIA